MNSSKKLLDEITNLSKEWYILINRDHHKDRDCHWTIETTWSYGDKPTFQVIHHGYVHEKIEVGFNTYEDALIGLKSIIKRAIKNEKEAQKLQELDLLTFQQK